jgi:hypothetical protein
VCREFGSPRTPFLLHLNQGPEALPEVVRTLVIRKSRHELRVLPGARRRPRSVPAEDSSGQPTDFPASARLSHAPEIGPTGEGIYDNVLATSHLGILNSPDTWKATL